MAVHSSSTSVASAACSAAPRPWSVARRACLVGPALLLACSLQGCFRRSHSHHHAPAQRSYPPVPEELVCGEETDLRGLKPGFSGSRLAAWQGDNKCGVEHQEAIEFVHTCTNYGLDAYCYDAVKAAMCCCHEGATKKRRKFRQAWMRHQKYSKYDCAPHGVAEESYAEMQSRTKTDAEVQDPDDVPAANAKSMEHPKVVEKREKSDGIANAAGLTELDQTSQIVAIKSEATKTEQQHLPSHSSLAEPSGASLSDLYEKPQPEVAAISFVDLEHHVTQSTPVDSLGRATAVHEASSSANAAAELRLSLAASGHMSAEVRQHSPRQSAHGA